LSPLSVHMCKDNSRPTLNK